MSLTQGVPLEAESIFDDLATYLNPRLVELSGARAPKFDLPFYTELASDEHKIVWVGVSAGELVIEADLKNLANEVNKLDKKYRIKGFLKSGGGIKLKMPDKTHKLFSYIALSPQDADSYLGELK